MAATIFITDTSTWSVSGRVFYFLLEAARSADTNPTSRFPSLIDLFDGLQGISLDRLDDSTRADVLDALRKGTAAILARLESESDMLLPPLSNDALISVFRELEQLLTAAASDPYLS